MHIRPKWADFPLDKVKPMAVEKWLRDLPLAPKSGANVRSIMHLIFKCAERWELIEIGKNPIALVRVKGYTKRLTTHRVLTAVEFAGLLPYLKEPYRTMVIVAQCLGLRVSEIVALQSEGRQPPLLFRRRLHPHHAADFGGLPQLRGSPAAVKLDRPDARRGRVPRSSGPGLVACSRTKPRGVLSAGAGATDAFDGGGRCG